MVSLFTTLSVDEILAYKRASSLHGIKLFGNLGRMFFLHYILLVPNLDIFNSRMSLKRNIKIKQQQCKLRLELFRGKYLQEFFTSL